MAEFDDDQGRYRAVLERRVHAGDRVLHFGCGWDRTGIVPMLAGRGAEVVGLEVDPSAADRYPAPVFVTDGGRLPFGDGSFDLVASEYVFEHLECPAEVFAELSRVLRPGGALVVLTPNRWSYKSVVAALTPHAVHRLAARTLRPDAREAADVYPTFYRANTERTLRHLGAAAGLSLVDLVFLNNGPTWFRKTPGLFAAGVVYHRLLRRPALRRLRCGLLATCEKRPHWSDAGEGERAAARGPLVLRCTTCAHAPMTASETGARCPRCRHGFRTRGPVTDTRAGGA